jgi:hypothetical protein
MNRKYLAPELLPSSDEEEEDEKDEEEYLNFLNIV